MDKVQKNFEVFHQFQNAGKYKEASEWVNNAYYSLFLNSQQINPLQMAFAVLLSTHQELSEHKLKEKIAELAEKGLTQQIIIDEISFFFPELAKNLNSNLE